MQPSSTGVLLGNSELVIQPFNVLPSKSKSQPARFSFDDSLLSAWFECGCAGSDPPKKIVSVSVTKKQAVVARFVWGEATDLPQRCASTAGEPLREYAR